MSNIYAKLADVIVAHPKKIIVAWIVLLLIALPIGIQTFTNEDVLVYDMTEMIDDSYDSVKGLEIMADTNYYETGGASVDVIVVVEDPADPAKMAAFQQDLSSDLIKKYGPEVMLTPMGNFQSEDGETSITLFSVMFPEGYSNLDQIDPLRGIISDIDSGLTTYVTGNSAMNHDTEVGALEDVKKIDPFTILLILILIGLFFRSLVAAAVPPATIGFAYAMVLAVIFAIAQFMGVYYITSTIVLIAMMGAGCDYCIFILARYREERKAGKDHTAALKESVTWAGESITTSGISVIIGFGAMAICSFAMIRSMGLVLAAGVLFALLVALTLIPSILALVGDKIFYPTKLDALKEDSKVMKGWYGKVSAFGDRYFRNSAKHAIKYSVPIVVAAILITIPLGYVAVTNEGSYDMIGAMPESEAKEGIDTIVEYADGGIIMPTYVLMEREVAAGSAPLFIKDSIDLTEQGLGQLGVWYWTPEGKEYTNWFMITSTKMQNEIDGISMVSGPVDMEAAALAYKQAMSAVDPDMTEFDALVGVLTTQFGEYADMFAGLIQGMAMLPMEATYGIVNFIINDQLLSSVSNEYDGLQYMKMMIVVEDEPMSDESMEIIGEAKEFIKNEVEASNGLFSNGIVTGTVAATYDMSKTVTDEFKIVEVVVILLIFLLLFFVMKSYFTPIRALITIIMSVIWTLGLTFIVFDMWLGLPVIFMIPIVLFVICLGLGMDYDILLTTRIKENVHKGMTNDEAIEEAIHKSGSVITICGLIMAGAFGTMMLSSSPMLMEIGFSLCFAIAVDALVVRTYIVPAVMHLMGKWNWVGPSWLKGKKASE